METFAVRRLKAMCGAWLIALSLVGNGANGLVPKPKIHVTKIFLDVGHGGKDLGAVGFSNAPEKDICLLLAKLTRQALEKKAGRLLVPVDIKLSREKDNFLVLGDRAQMANQWEADLFVSLHANSSSARKARGFEIYFLHPDGTDVAARKLAHRENRDETLLNSDVLGILNDVQAQVHVVESSRLAESLFTTMNRTVKANVNGVRQAPFSVLTGTAMPAVLLEIGYLTNKEDAKNLGSLTYLKGLADAISTGIIDYLLLKRKVT